MADYVADYAADPHHCLYHRYLRPSDSATSDHPHTCSLTFRCSDVIVLSCPIVCIRRSPGDDDGVRERPTGEDSGALPLGLRSLLLGEDTGLLLGEPSVCALLSCPLALAAGLAAAGLAAAGFGKGLEGFAASLGGDSATGVGRLFTADWLRAGVLEG